MTYTVWFDGVQIGETAFEMRHGSRRRAGVFQPTEFGLSVLPRVTRMALALLDTGRECQARGLDLDDADPDPEIVDSLLQTPPGKRMIEAARDVGRLELRSPSGDTIEWDSILISDLLELREVAGESTEDLDAARADPLGLRELLESGPIRFLISATFSEQRRAAPPRRMMM